MSDALDTAIKARSAAMQRAVDDPLRYAAYRSASYYESLLSDEEHERFMQWLRSTRPSHRQGARDE